MASPEQLKEARELEKRQTELTFEYRNLVESYAGRDLIDHLTTIRDNSLRIAGEEMENLDKKALYLQDANAYGKVLAYITDKAS